jgi:hypothetical protein
MPEMESEKAGAVPASKIVDGETAHPQDPPLPRESEESIKAPQTGRLPARASRS